ncbi:uncharacterized protein LOC128869829 [Anastrepha ludens]|uniref:uncharacterized protein LOC128869829 n=1 Tax=Anastrepha ludens TaxID=28586 RepID=UPI0023B02D1D|nr:uncharacterized protein LOC128869829 [Anastrepha ludens]
MRPKGLTQAEIERFANFDWDDSADDEIDEEEDQNMEEIIEKTLKYLDNRAENVEVGLIDQIIGSKDVEDLNENEIVAQEYRLSNMRPKGLTQAEIERFANFDWDDSADDEIDEEEDQNMEEIIEKTLKYLDNRAENVEVGLIDQIIGSKDVEDLNENEIVAQEYRLSKMRPKGLTQAEIERFANFDWDDSADDEIDEEEDQNMEEIIEKTLKYLDNRAENVEVGLIDQIIGSKDVEDLNENEIVAQEYRLSKMRPKGLTQAEIERFANFDWDDSADDEIDEEEDQNMEEIIEKTLKYLDNRAENVEVGLIDQIIGSKDVEDLNENEIVAQEYRLSKMRPKGLTQAEIERFAKFDWDDSADDEIDEEEDQNMEEIIEKTLKYLDNRAENVEVGLIDQIIGSKDVEDLNENEIVAQEYRLSKMRPKGLTQAEIERFAKFDWDDSADDEIDEEEDQNMEEIIEKTLKYLDNRAENVEVGLTDQIIGSKDVEDLNENEIVAQEYRLSKMRPKGLTQAEIERFAKFDWDDSADDEIDEEEDQNMEEIIEKTLKYLDNRAENVEVGLIDQIIGSKDVEDLNENEIVAQEYRLSKMRPKGLTQAEIERFAKFDWDDSADDEIDEEEDQNMEEIIEKTLKYLDNRAENVEVGLIDQIIGSKDVEDLNENEIVAQEHHQLHHHQLLLQDVNQIPIKELILKTHQNHYDLAVIIIGRNEEQEADVEYARVSKL